MILTAALAGAAVLAQPTAARADSVTDFSSGLSTAVATSTIAGSEAVRLSGRYVVAAVETTAHGLRVILRPLGEGTATALHLSARAGEAAVLAVGEVVVASATAAGVLLTAAGRAVALVPERMAGALMHESAYGPAR